MLLHNPFEQFQVTTHYFVEKKWSGLFSFLNHEIYINDTIIVTFFINLFFFLCYYKLSLKRVKLKKSTMFNGWKNMYEFLYFIVCSFLPIEGRKYFPFFFYLFMFITFSNYIGIIPFSFTITSHLSITFALSFTVWFAGVIIGFTENGIRYFSLFYPRGVPFVLVPFLVGIEVISYIFRSVSLALRLFANIVAGHILLDTLALFIYKMLLPISFKLTNILIIIIPFIMCIILIIFECIVAILQAYIFTVLSCIYLRDSYNAQMH
jgi:F-type H+-transporting ATPase subunit a